MSQTYVIKVSASVQEHVRAKDKRVKKIVLTEIVSKEEQKELVRGQLVERGFEQEGADPDVLVRRKGEVLRPRAELVRTYRHARLRYTTLVSSRFNLPR